MVRVIAIGTGGPESCPRESINALKTFNRRFHVDPNHRSFVWLQEIGFPCDPMPSEGTEGECAIVIPIDIDLQIDASKRTTRREAIEALVQVVDRLLGPGGCPWDREQTHETLKKHLVEETYEVLDAIDTGSKDKLKEELGDLLLQPIMHAQMESAAGGFDVADVANTITDKLVRRHPHVFGPLSVEDADEVLKNWDRIKQSESTNDANPESDAEKSILEGVPKNMPALHRAYEISKRAARVGFEWPDIDAVFEKLDEENAELRSAIAESLGRDSEVSHGRIAEEIGDLLFTVVNIARWCKVEPEEALRAMVNRFTARFQLMERSAAKPLRELTAEEWDAQWQKAKSLTTRPVS